MPRRIFKRSGTRFAPITGFVLRRGTCETPIAQALARHKAAQAPSTPNFGDKLFTAESDTFKVLVETPCASDAEFVKKLRYLLAHEARIVDGPPNGHQEFGSILVAVDRHFKSVSTRCR
jgi:hypothetical protein